MEDLIKKKKVELFGVSNWKERAMNKKLDVEWDDSERLNNHKEKDKYKTMQFNTK